jgi:hypothetical protein
VKIFGWDVSCKLARLKQLLDFERRRKLRSHVREKGLTSLDKKGQSLLRSMHSVTNRHRQERPSVHFDIRQGGCNEKLSRGDGVGLIDPVNAPNFLHKEMIIPDLQTLKPPSSEKYSKTCFFTALERKNKG